MCVTEQNHQFYLHSSAMIIVIINIIITTTIISFMQGLYTYIPETNCP